jgi:hypothetical protein
MREVNAVLVIQKSICIIAEASYLLMPMGKNVEYNLHINTANAFLYKGSTQKSIEASTYSTNSINTNLFRKPASLILKTVWGMGVDQKDGGKFHGITKQI